MRAILIALSTLLLAGCVTKPVEKADAAAAETGTSNTEGPAAVDAMGGTPIYNLVREFAAPGTFVGPAPTAVVILKAEQTSRNKAFCNGFVKLETPTSAVTDANFAEPMLATRWLLKVSTLSAADAASCDRILAEYDFARADAMRADLVAAGIKSTKFEGGGPFIVQFPPTGGVIVVSATGFSEANLKAFAQNWDGVAAQLDTLAAADASDVDQKLPASCNIVTDAATGCSIERMALDTAAWTIKKKFPEAEVAIAVGQRVACIFLKPAAKAKWCPPAAA